MVRTEVGSLCPIGHIQPMELFDLAQGVGASVVFGGRELHLCFSDWVAKRSSSGSWVLPAAQFQPGLGHSDPLPEKVTDPWVTAFTKLVGRHFLPKNHLLNTPIFFHKKCVKGKFLTFIRLLLHYGMNVSK